MLKVLSVLSYILLAACAPASVGGATEKNSSTPVEATENSFQPLKFIGVIGAGNFVTFDVTIQEKPVGTLREEADLTVQASEEDDTFFLHGIFVNGELTIKEACERLPGNTFHTCVPIKDYHNEMIRKDGADMLVTGYNVVTQKLVEEFFIPTEPENQPSPPPSPGHQRVALFFFSSAKIDSMKQMFIYEVAPLAVLPFQKSVFSYTSSQKISIGSVVTIPFSGRVLTGVVLGTLPKDSKENKLKEITTIANRLPLTQKQILLAKEVSALTYTPLGKVLKHLVPPQAKARTLITAEKIVSFTPLPESVDQVKKILTSLTANNALFFVLTMDYKSLEILLQLVLKIHQKEKGQILVLVPDIAAAVRLEKNWEAYCNDTTLVSLFHTKTPGQFFSAWEKIQNGNAKIIIATRSGLFAPFQNLRAIIHIDPSDDGYKQWDMSPRYQTSEVIGSLRNMWDAKLIEIGSTPSLSALAKDTLIIPNETRRVSVEWVNLKLERYKKNWGALSASLEQSIRSTLTEKRQSLVYVHQAGLESFSVCTECRTIFRCPSCQNALRLSLKDTYNCKRCGFKSSLFPSCRQCKNISFKSVGFGTEKVAREIQKKFPGAIVSIADKTHFPDPKKLQKFFNEPFAKQPDILIATGSFLRFPPLSRLSLVAIIDADTVLNIPGFRKDEQFVELISKLHSLTPTTGKMVVQTFLPENDLFRKIESEPITSVLSHILEERKLLHYPPVYRSAIIEERPNPKKNTLAFFTQSLKKDILTNPEAKKNILLQNVSMKVRGQEKKYLLLRYLPPLSETLHQFLVIKADSFFIDHDPLSFT